MYRKLSLEELHNRMLAAEKADKAKPSTHRYYVVDDTGYAWLCEGRKHAQARARYYQAWDKAKAASSDSKYFTAHTYHVERRAGHAWAIVQ